MKQYFRVACAFLLAVLLAGCTYTYDEPRPPEEVTASPEMKLVVKNIASTPNGFEVTQPFPAEGPCSYGSTWLSLFSEREDYSALVAEYVKNATLPASELKNGSLRPNLHYEKGTGVTTIVPDDLYRKISASNGMIRVHRQEAESLVRDNLSDFQAFLRMVGADDTTGFYIAKASCLGEGKPFSSSSLCPFKPLDYDGPVSLHSPSCVPYTMIAGQPMRLDGLPETGVCSIEHANRTSIVEIDFTRYIGTGFIADPRPSLLIGNGTVVVLSANSFALLNVLAPEIPNDGRQIYPITPKSHVSLRAAIPSLDSLMKSTADQMISGTEGLEGRTFYIASDKCRPVMVRQ